MLPRKGGIGGIDQPVLLALQLDHGNMDIAPERQHFGELLFMVDLFLVRRLQHTWNEPMYKGRFDKISEPEDLLLARTYGRRNEHEAVDQLWIIHGKTAGDGAAIRDADHDNRMMRLMQTVEDGFFYRGLRGELRHGIGQTGISITRPVGGIHRCPAQQRAVRHITPPITKGAGSAMDEQDGRIGRIPGLQVTDLSSLGHIIPDLRVDMMVMKPGEQILIIHSELNQPVKDK